jgi:hypothetical protein
MCYPVSLLDDVVICYKGRLQPIMSWDLPSHNCAWQLNVPFEATELCSANAMLVWHAVP